MSLDAVPPQVAGPQAETSVTPAPPPATAPRVLAEAERVLLRAVLNCVVPPRAELPGAGDLDVGASIEHSMAASSRLRRLFLDGLGQISLTAAAQTGVSFGELDEPSQVAVLQAVERAWPAFFVALVEHAYRGYYILPAVHQAVGWDSRPPQPLGHRLPPFDLALLDRQRGRAPFWRPTS